jgi:hypothetical protein
MYTLTVVLYIISQKDVLSPDVLSLRTFCPARRFVSTDILSLRTFCLFGRFVSMDVSSHGRYVSGCFVSGCFVSGCFVPTDVLSPDVLSGHLVYIMRATTSRVRVTLYINLVFLMGTIHFPPF